MESPNIPRGKHYTGPRGAANAHVPVSEEEYRARIGRDHVTAVDPATGERFAMITGRISLKHKGSDRPVELEPLTPTMGEDPLPAAVRTLFSLCARYGRRFDSHRHRVRPVSARSRLVSRAQEVVYVRVWVRGGCVMRAWRRPEGTDKWSTLFTGVYRPWRQNAVGQPISAKEANEVIKAGVWEWES